MCLLCTELCSAPEHGWKKMQSQPSSCLQKLLVCLNGISLTFRACKKAKTKKHLVQVLGWVNSYTVSCEMQVRCKVASLTNDFKNGVTRRDTENRVITGRMGQSLILRGDDKNLFLERKAGAQVCTMWQSFQQSILKVFKNTGCVLNFWEESICGWWDIVSAMVKE